MSQIPDRLSGAHGKARGRSLTALFALALSAGAAHAGEIRGRLLVGDRAEKPAAGATLSAVPWESPFDEARREAKAGEAPKPFATAVAGPDGSFLLTVPAEPGREKLFRVRAEGGGVVPAVFEDVFDAAENENLGERVLPAAGTLVGKVVDASGAPVAGAEVRLIPGGLDGDPDMRAATRATETAGDGTFRFSEAGAQGNSLTIEKAGFARALEVGLRGGVAARPIVLGPGVSVSGVVNRADRRPAAGALVRLEGKSTTRWVETDAEGRFTIAHAAAGRATLAVDAGEAGFARRPDVKLPLADGKPLAVGLTVPASLEGRVVDERTGRAVPRARLFLKGTDFGRLARSGPDGAFRFRGVPARSYRLTVDEARYVPWVKNDIPLVPGETKRLDLALVLGATITGRIVDENGAAIAGAKGSLTRGAENPLAGLARMFRRGRETSAFRTLADGSFKASRLAPGENQRLVATHPDFERTTLAGVSLAGGSTKAGVAVVMRRGATVTGFAKDGNGQPVADVEVELGQSFSFRGGRGGLMAQVGLVGGPGSRPRAKTGADGRFEIKGVSQGEYSLSAQRSGFATERIDPVKVTDRGAEPVSITLVPGATISGSVRRRTGEGAEGFFVNAGASGRPAMLQGGRQIQPTGPDGQFLIEGLRSGQSYDLSVFGGTGLGPQKRGVTAPADGVEITVSDTGRIAGTALDARSGHPLTDFSVSYEADRGGGGSVMRIVGRAAGRAMGTGIGEKREIHAEDGSFVLEDVPAGTWTVAVTAKGYQPAHVASIVVEEGATRGGVEVKAVAAGSLKGRVTDAKSGRAIPNATVTHEAAGSGPGFGRLVIASGGDEAEITTDAEGRFEIEGLATGRVKVSAKHPDYADGSEVADLKEGGASVEIHMVSGGALGGAVLSDQKQPLPGVDVSLAAAGENGFGRYLAGGQSTTTDGAGRFRFEHLAAGRYSVSAAFRGKTSNLVDAVLQAGEAKEDVLLSLAAGTTLRGTVSGLPDGWKSSVMVTATGADSFFANTRADADGRFEITGVPAGPVTLRAQAGDGLGTSRSAMKQVRADDAVPVLETEIAFDAGFTLSGRVTRAGQPLPNAVVAANLQGGGGRQAASRTDESGAYRLEGLQEGTYAVIANADVFAGGSSTRKSVTLNGDQSLDLAFPTAKISGIVTDGGSKQPLADATVELAGAAGTGPFQRMSTTDSNGLFTFTDLDLQAYTLNARKADYQYDKRAVTAADDGSSENLSIELTRGEGIGIRVKDGVYGVPLRGVLARVFDGARSPVFTGTLSLDRNGVGEIPSLKPGRYSLIVDASGYAPAVLDGVSVPSQTVPITLTPGGSIDITAGPKTLAAGTAHATLKTASGTPYPYTAFNIDGRVVVSADGSGQRGFRRIENVAPGSYTLAVDGGASKVFSVAEGGLTPVELP
jgi:protocatechuate 3,4-dioxygenase beta subunit